MNQSSHRNNLTPNQIHILKLIHKFRYVSVPLLSKYKKVQPSAINKSLATLADLGYIGRNYDASYNLQGKAASYYLMPKALLYLRDNYGFNERVLHNMYKDKAASPEFISHSLDAFAIYLALRDSYPDTFHIFTKTELADFDYFMSPRPDLYLNRIKPQDNVQNEFVLELFTNSQFFVIKKRITAIIEHFESGDWEAEAETAYPTVLLVCAEPKAEKRLQHHVAKTLDNEGIDELTVYTTNLKTLNASTAATRTIWADSVEPKSLRVL